MSFTFNEKSNELAKIALAKYPDDRKQSAVMPFLDIAQRQNNNWLSQECIEYVADQLEMPFIKVWEIVTFYTMYNTQPVGKNFVQVCFWEKEKVTHGYGMLAHRTRGRFFELWRLG